jgi:hypothetical protein
VSAGTAAGRLLRGLAPVLRRFGDRIRVQDIHGFVERTRVLPFLQVDMAAPPAYRSVRMLDADGDGVATAAGRDPRGVRAAAGARGAAPGAGAMVPAGRAS